MKSAGERADRRRGFHAFSPPLPHSESVLWPLGALVVIAARVMEQRDG